MVGRTASLPGEWKFVFGAGRIITLPFGEIPPICMSNRTINGSLVAGGMVMVGWYQFGACLGE